MPKRRKRETQDEARARGERLRVLKGHVRSLGKLGLKGTFTAGKALEEAAELLRGDYSSWVRTECGLDPRTALGYRKTFRVLWEYRENLAKHDVPASVAVMVACAKPDARDRALAAILSGRSLTVSEAKRVLALGSDKPKPVRPAALEAFARLVRERADAVVADAAKIAALAAVEAPDETQLGEMAVRARVMQPLLSAVSKRVSGLPPMDADPVAAALSRLATAAGHDGIGAAASAFAELMKGPRDTAASTMPAHDAGMSVSPAGNVMHERVCTPYRHGLTALEICAGAGGAALGLSQAGFRHLGLVEHNPHACDTLRKAFGPDHVIETDLATYEPEGLEGLDLLSGGVPCQGFSQSGEMKGADDERDLFPKALRLVERLRPRAVLLENVTGLFGPSFDTYRFEIQTALRRLGYANEWRRVHATHFGVPQNRVRVILAAFRDPDAMTRFRWPRAWVPHHEHEPFSVASALTHEIESRGYRMSEDQKDRMERACTTIIGGSEKKQSADLGQQNGSKPWRDMGFVTTRFADEPPGPDHVGDIVLTRPMLAILQGFPRDWPFAGDNQRIFKQIANAFPPPVALHLGCAIASALTGEPVDPARHFVHFGRRRVRLPMDLVRRAPAASRPTSVRAEPLDHVSIPLERLRAAATATDEADPAIQGLEFGWTMSELLETSSTSTTVT